MVLHYKENILKSALVLMVAVAFYPFTLKSVEEIQADQMGNFLLVISMLLVTVCFANFAFTYERSRLNTTTGRLLAHATTFLFMSLISLMLESVALSVQVVYPSFAFLIWLFCSGLYLSLILYDFWDFFRNKHV